MSVEVVRPQHHFFTGLIDRSVNYVDHVSKMSPLISTVKDRSMSLAKPYVELLQPYVVKSLRMVDGAADEVILRGDKVYRRVVDIRSRVADSVTKADHVRAEKQKEFVARACELWTKVHAHPGPVSFAELQTHLKALYDETLAQPTGELINTLKSKQGESYFLRAKKISDKAVRVTVAGIDFLVTVAEQQVDLYLPELEGDAEVTGAVEKKETLPLATRVQQLPVKVTRRMSANLGSRLNHLSRRTNESMKDLVHIDLIGYAQNQRASLLKYSQVRCENMAQMSKETWSSIQANGPKVLHSVSDPARREELKALLREVIVNIRSRAAGASAQMELAVLKGRGRLNAVKADLLAQTDNAYSLVDAKYHAARSIALEKTRLALDEARKQLRLAFAMLDDRVSAETKETVLSVYRKAYNASRAYLGPDMSDAVVHFFTQNLVVHWILADDCRMTAVASNGQVSELPPTSTDEAAAVAPAEETPDAVDEEARAAKSPAASSPKRRAGKKGAKAQQE